MDVGQGIGEADGPLSINGEQATTLVGGAVLGMGQDGLRGCELISSAGGRILVQDAATSVVWGMPGAVAKAGLADKVLPLNQIAAELNRLAFIFRPKSQSTVPTSFPLTL